MSDTLPLRTRVLYGLGDWGPTTTSTAFMFFYSFFLTDVANLPPALVAPVLLAGGIWDAVNDPIIGVLADRVRSRWGRRRPFFLFGAVPFAVSFILLWWVPPFDSIVLKALYYGAVYILFDTAFTAVSVPYVALTPELTENYDERTRLNGYRMTVSMGGGLIVVIALPLVVRLFAEPKTGYLATAAVFGALGALPYFLLFFGIRERFETTPEPKISILEGFRTAFRNRPFRYAAGIYLTSWITVSLVAALFQYYLTYHLRMADAIEIVLGVVQLSALLFIAPIVKLSTALGKQRAYLIGIGSWVLVMLAISFLPADAGTIVYVLAAAAGFGIAAAHVIPWAIVPDIIEADELSSGKRREGMYYGFLVFMEKTGAAFALAFIQWVLSVSGYTAGADQTPGTLVAMRLLIGPLPAALLAVSMLCAVRFPITKRRHEEIRGELAVSRRDRAAGRN